jgi:hypothetical protein
MQSNPKFPGATPVPTDGGPVRYEYAGGGSWSIDPDDPYFHNTPDGSFKVPEDSSYRTGGADAKVRITEQKLDPGVVKVELDLDEIHMLTEIHFTVRNADEGSPEAKFYLRGDVSADTESWVLTPYGDSAVKAKKAKRAKS